MSMSFASNVLAERVRAGPQKAVGAVERDEVLCNRRQRKRRGGTVPTEQAAFQPSIEVKGVLELRPKGYGFLRDVNRELQAAPGEVFVPSNLIERLGLRAGMMVEGAAVQLRSSEGPKLQQAV